MSVFRYTIMPESQWRTPLRSDTLHGLLLCAMAELDGEEKVKDVIADFQADKFLFTCSSAMPAGFLPMPCLPPIPRVYFQKKYPTELVDILQEYKRFNKKSFMPLVVFEKEGKNLCRLKLFQSWREYQKNKEINISDIGDIWEYPVGKVESEPHNTISRQNNVVLEGGLFFPEVLFHSPDQKYNIYVQTEQPKQFEYYLEHIGSVGFGADSATGKGRFSLVGQAENVSYLFESKGEYLFSLGVMSGMDMSTIQGYYKVFTKKGKVWSEKSAKTPFKKSFIALAEGAIFKSVKTVPAKQILKNLHPDSELVQLCHTLCLPCGLSLDTLQTLGDKGENKYE